MKAPNDDDDEDDRKPRAREGGPGENDGNSSASSSDGDKKPEAQRNIGSRRAASGRRRTRSPDSDSSDSENSDAQSQDTGDDDIIEGETKQERRRRMNRMSAKKKRAKKLIELDFLKEESQRLTDENRSIREHNDHLRERIALVKSFLPSLSQPTAAPNVAVATTSAGSSRAGLPSAPVSAPAPTPAAPATSAQSTSVAAMPQPGNQPQTHQQSASTATGDLSFLLQHVARQQQGQNTHSSAQSSLDLNHTGALQQLLLNQQSRDRQALNVPAQVSQVLGHVVSKRDEIMSLLLQRMSPGIGTERQRVDDTPRLPTQTQNQILEQLLRPGQLSTSLSARSESKTEESRDSLPSLMQIQLMMANRSRGQQQRQAPRDPPGQNESISALLTLLEQRQGTTQQIVPPQNRDHNDPWSTVLRSQQLEGNSVEEALRLHLTDGQQQVNGPWSTALAQFLSQQQRGDTAQQLLNLDHLLQGPSTNQGTLLRLLESQQQQAQRPVQAEAQQHQALLQQDQQRAAQLQALLQQLPQSQTSNLTATQLLNLLSGAQPSQNVNDAAPAPQNTNNLSALEQELRRLTRRGGPSPPGGTPPGSCNPS